MITTDKDTYDSYPLDWPAGYKKTKSPEQSRYKNTSINRDRDRIMGEIYLLRKQLNKEGRSIIISTNIRLRKDGLPNGSAKHPDDCGVAVYFELGDRTVCLACDKWNHIADNMHAIALTLDAMRGTDRWGVSDMLERMFKGFLALPPRRSWFEILGVAEACTLDEAKEAYHDLMKTYHPDKGGDSGVYRSAKPKSSEAIE